MPEGVTRLALLLVLVVVACRSGPEIRPGPAVTPTFSAPAGLTFEESWTQKRAVEVSFDGGDDRSVNEELSGLVVERWLPQRDGSFRIVSELRSESTRRDGVRVPTALPLAGVTFAHQASRDGAFLGVRDVAETLAELRERATDDRLRRMIEPLLTEEVLEKRARLSWSSRFDGVCGVALAPGDHSWSIDEQELSAGGPARTIVRRTVIGETTLRGRRVVELALEFGGLDSALAREEGARATLEAFEGTRRLTPGVKGTGVRYVAVQGCHTLLERIHLTGKVPLDTAGPRAAGLSGYPERVRFDVERSVERRLPGEPG